MSVAQSSNPSSVTTHKSVLKRYRRLVDEGFLEGDPMQIVVARKLDALNADLAERRLANKKSSLGWLFSKRKSAWRDVLGLYVWGGVGRGKTMLMDLFFEFSPIRRKKRVHFHEFMADVHDRIHAQRQQIKNGNGQDGDPILPVADQIATEVRLLCFDEFTVRDVADATIMRRLFGRLFEHNVVMVATSNVAPDDLYMDGLRRLDFMPFIAMLKGKVAVLHLDAAKDFRLDKLGRRKIYAHPLGPVSDKTIDEVWDALTKGVDVESDTIVSKGREIPVPRSALGVARFLFADLCEAPLGASDYLKIARRYHTVFVEHIPVFTAEKRNEAKRFINCIDAFYDAHVKLVASAAAAPHELNRGLRDVEAFEFDRTISRLIEMQSDEYLGAERAQLNRAEEAS